MSIRFHLDEHIPKAIANGLRRHGIDVTTSDDAALLGQDDEAQLAFASAEGRVLVTHDHHFTIPERRISEHCGVCYCHFEKYSFSELLDALLVVAQCLSEGELKNNLHYL
jgi:predicted nuclease of predicted toxin-antitoxin system